MVSIIISVSMTIIASNMVMSVSPDCVTKNEVMAGNVFEMQIVRQVTVCFSIALQDSMALCATQMMIATVADATSRNLNVETNLNGTKLAQRIAIVVTVTACFSSVSMVVMVTFATQTTIATQGDAACLGVKLGGGKATGVQLTIVVSPETAPGCSNASEQKMFSKKRVPSSGMSLITPFSFFSR